MHKVVVVDDDPKIVTLLSFILKKEGEIHYAKKITYSY